MTDFLLATASVHVTAAAADYLQDRLGPAGTRVGQEPAATDPVGDEAVGQQSTSRGSADDDSIVVVAVRDPDAPSRDAGDALNVARSRLAEFEPTTETREGAPVSEILAAIDEHDPDEIIVGPHRGSAAADGVGATAQAVIERVNRPVVVVPLH